MKQIFKEVKTRIGPNSAAHEMLRVINSRGGTMNAQDLNRWDPDYINKQRIQGAYVSSHYFSRNFVQNMYALIANGLVTVDPSAKAVERIIHITELGRSEIVRLEPKAIAKQAEIDDRNKAAEINESMVKEWEAVYKNTSLLQEFLDMGFQETDKQGPSPQPGVACENLRCRMPRSNGGPSDGNMKVVLFQCQCGHQKELRMEDEIKAKYRSKKEGEEEDE